MSKPGVWNRENTNTLTNPGRTETPTLVLPSQEQAGVTERMGDERRPEWEFSVSLGGETAQL